MRTSKEILELVQSVAQADAAEITLAAEGSLPPQEQEVFTQAFEVLGQYYALEKRFRQTGYMDTGLAPFLPLQEILDSEELVEKREFYQEECRILKQERLFSLWRQMLSTRKEGIRVAASGQSGDQILRSANRAEANELDFANQEAQVSLRVVRVDNRWELMIHAHGEGSIKSVKIGDVTVKIEYGYGEIEISKLDQHVPPIIGIDQEGREIPLHYTSEK